MAADPRVRHVIALLERCRETPPSLAELSRAVNLSPAHLTRLFRRDVGTSPASFGRSLRLDYARDLLQTSFMTVKQVMAASGWNDPSHFCREFKRRHGHSPLAFRRHAAAAAADEIPDPTDEVGDEPG
ncbi:MAG: Transcriptional regulator containing an amidase domain and an AraC-type DNA-binding domain [Acidobacteria bacterium]|nr:Transcriptional regulator containing an amidase domain and an AraC-type DNA-binding domain [Acidobacteriota bacterium]